MYLGNLKSWIIVAGFSAIFNHVNGQTFVSGNILTDTTWTVAGSPYIVTGNTLVNNGVTLTIEPGVTVKFDAAKTLQIDGELIASGTATGRITFTSTQAVPTTGAWGRIQFSDNSADAVFDTLGNYVSGSIMKYCDILYGGGVGGTGTLHLDAAAPYFFHCKIYYCLKHALYFVGVTGRIDSSSIRNCGGSALYFASISIGDLIMRNDSIENNAGGIVQSGTGSFTNVTIRNCLFANTGNAISVASSGNFVLEKCKFISNSTAVNVLRSANSVISNNEFTANINVLQGSLGSTSISGNTFSANTHSVLGDVECVSDFFGSGVNVSTLVTTDLTIANNYFEGNKGSIYASANYSTIQGNIFRNNQFVFVVDCDNWYLGGTGGNLYELIDVLSTRGIIINNVFEGNSSVGNNGNMVRANKNWEIANNIIANNSPGRISCNGNPTICSNAFLNNSGSIIVSSGSSAGSSIHHNQFLNNSVGNVTISISNSSVINNNEFRGNSPTGPIISITGGTSTVSNNRFLSNLNAGYPIVLISNSNSGIHNNDFLNNNGVSLRINGSTLQPVVQHNNFVNPGVQFELQNQIPFGSGNLYVSENYWGTTRTTHIDSVIQDYFDSDNFSIAYYTPFLTSPAIIDSAALCFQDTAVELSGAIVTETGIPVPGVSVVLSGDYNLIMRTDSSGGYHFSVPQYGDYTITVSEKDDSMPHNGITLIDALLMRRHILGTPLNSPYKIIAAAEQNADGDTTITTQDILFTRSLILGNITSFPTNRLWQFVSSDYMFPDNSHPFPFPTSRTYTNITTNQTNQNFIGIKLGDVNDSWDPNTP